MTRPELIKTAETLLDQIIDKNVQDNIQENLKTGLEGLNFNVFYLNNFRELFQEIIRDEKEIPASFYESLAAFEAGRVSEMTDEKFGIDPAKKNQ